MDHNLQRLGFYPARITHWINSFVSREAAQSKLIFDPSQMAPPALVKKSDSKNEEPEKKRGVSPAKKVQG